ncbi:uncharacterized protein [Henckelia pumila]|uniref:uncharacterized protein n=1 Tax=Henckelia pumila TaxID=405737 RepID=UPI003C6DF04D
MADFIRDDGQWDMEKIILAFPKFEVDEILNIPLNPRGGHDVRFWKWDKRGIYTVKTGYLLEMGLLQPSPHQSEISMRSRWNKIWNLKMPPKPLISEYILANKTQQSLPLGQISSARWVAPTSGQLRFDVDARFDNRRGCYSIGAIIRDCKGMLLAASSYRIRNPGSVFEGELWAIRCGMELVLRCSLKKIWVFSDSLEAITAINSDSEYLSPDGVLIKAIKDLLSEDVFLGFKHTSRQSNSAAHKLAQFAFSSPNPCTWCFVDFSSWLQDIVTLDLVI